MNGGRALQRCMTAGQARVRYWWTSRSACYVDRCVGVVVGGEERYWWTKIKKYRCDMLAITCYSQSVFVCLMHIGREHKRYWWTRVRVLDSRKCVVMKCMFVWQEPVVQIVFSCILCVLGVNINVTGGQAQKYMLC